MNKYIKTHFMSCAVMIFAALMLTACLEGVGKKAGEVKPVLMKSVTTFKDPESVTYDKKRDQFYVSQVNLAEKFGGGKIAIISSSGDIKELSWIEGLNNPKGLAVYDDKLYAADDRNLLEIDIEAGKVVKKYYGAGAESLNDVTVDDNGTVYVSDILGNKIFRLEQGKAFEVWLSDDQLEFPNGVLALDGALYVANWGKSADKTFESLLKAPPGKILKVNVNDKTVEPLTKEPLANIDGLAPDGKGHLFVSDWKAGKLYLVKLSDGSTVQSFDIAKILGIESAQGFADMTYVQDKQQLWAPLMFKGSVLVFSLADDARGSN